MQLPYFYEPEIILNENIYTLCEETSKHCAQVLRMKNGGQLLLTDGKGILATATIIAIDRKHTQVSIEKTEIIPTNAKKTHIGIGLLKNASRFEWFLEKATELGITHITPLITEHTEKTHMRQERMNGILIAAMLQSRQAWLPILDEPTRFEDYLAQSVSITQKWIAHCEDREKRDLAHCTMEKDVQILIGPEGDFSTSEINLALEQKYIPVSLGHTRLRTETAGVIAATLIQLL